MPAEPGTGVRGGTAVAALTARRTSRSAAVWGAVFALYLAASALGYASTYRDPASRRELAVTFGSNAGVNAVLGPAAHIDTVAGFVAWRSLVVLGVVGALWGLLTATRLLRGEEEAGRWELLLAGRTTRAGAAGQALAGLAAGLVVLWAVPATALALTGRRADVGIPVPAACFDALAVVGNAAVFLAVGALTSQLAATRRRAAGWAATALGVAYALRMVADSGAGLEWLRWTTPLGWTEEMRPLTGSRPPAALPLLGLVAVLGAVAVVLAGRRDLGASTLPDRSTARARTGLLGGPAGLALRLTRPTLVGWAVGIALGGLLLGLIAKTAGEALTSIAGARDVLERLGAAGTGAATYLGVAYLMVALLVGLLAAGQVAAARDEEAAGRLDHLLVRSATRRSWLAGRAALAVAAVLLAGLGAALATFAGAASQRAGVGLADLLQAGLNVVPPAVVVLGAGFLALGVRPRAAALVGYGLLAWSFLVELIGELIGADHWLLDTSLFHHMTAAPAVTPDWTADLVLVAVGVAAGFGGWVALGRRDVVGE